jgi:hypothetical protein
VTRRLFPKAKNPTNVFEAPAQGRSRFDPAVRGFSVVWSNTQEHSQFRLQLNRLEREIDMLHKRRVVADVVIGRHQKHGSSPRQFFESEEGISDCGGGASVPRLHNQVSQRDLGQQWRKETLMVAIEC